MDGDSKEASDSTERKERGRREEKNFNTRAETAKAPVHKNCPNKLLLTDVSFGSQVKDDVDVFGTEDVVQQPRVTHIPLLKKRVQMSNCAPGTVKAQLMINPSNYTLF